MIERVARTIERYRMLRPGDRAGAAVSGGADSVCLLHVLLELGWRPTVLHVNHKLRGAESDADAAFVRDLAASHNLPFEYREVELAGNVEQEGRRARHAFFLERLAAGLDRVATGHTRSDQAETVLYRLVRGSGTAGLAGIRPVTAEGIVRPLIEVARHEVEAWLRERGIPWREDVTNRDLSYARNRIRHELLPALAVLNPSLVDALARTAQVAQDEEDYWAGIVAPLAAGRLVARPPAVFLRADALTTLPRAVARRLARRAMEIAKGDLRSIDVLHVDALLALASSTEGSGRFQAPGLDVFRSFDWIRLAPPGTLERAEYRLEVPVPGRVAIPGTDWELALELTEPAELLNEKQSRYNSGDSTLDWERISGRVVVRNWRPGDHYQRLGSSYDTKLKTLFQEARVPLWNRRSWPVLIRGEAIVWAARFGPAAQYAATPRTRTALRVREFGSFGEF